jgi:hypothetical protein
VIRRWLAAFGWWLMDVFGLLLDAVGDFLEDWDW